MSRDNLGSEQTIILHNCLIENERFDLVITRHKQSNGYIRSTTRKKIIKQKQIIKRRFSEKRNAVSESDKNTIQELQDLKDSINKINPIENQNKFSDAEATSPASFKEKRRNKSHTLINQYDCTIGINQSDTLKVTH